MLRELNWEGGQLPPPRKIWNDAPVTIPFMQNCTKGFQAFMENWSWLSEGLASLGILGAQLLVPLKPFNTTVRGVSKGLQLEPYNAERRLSLRRYQMYVDIKVIYSYTLTNALTYINFIYVRFSSLDSWNPPPPPICTGNGLYMFLQYGETIWGKK